LILIVAIILRRRPRNAAAWLTLPEALLDDLLDLPLNTRDWTLAYWGFCLSPCGRTVGGWVAFVYSMLGFVSLIALNRVMGTPGGGLYEATLLFLTSLIAAVAVGAGLLSPQARLPWFLRRLRTIRRELLRPVGLWGWVSRMIAAIFFGFALVVAISVFMGLAFYALIAWSDALGPDIWDRLDGWLRHPAAPAASILLGVACGAASVGLWRSYANAVFERRLDAMDREFERIFRHLRFRRDPHGDPEREPAVYPAGYPYGDLRY
jgi:hypothetical protein